MLLICCRNCFDCSSFQFNTLLFPFQNVIVSPPPICHISSVFPSLAWPLTLLNYNGYFNMYVFVFHCKVRKLNNRTLCPSLYVKEYVYYLQGAPRVNHWCHKWVFMCLCVCLCMWKKGRERDCGAGWVLGWRKWEEIRNENVFHNYFWFIILNIHLNNQKCSHFLHLNWATQDWSESIIVLILSRLKYSN